MPSQMEEKMGMWMVPWLASLKSTVKEMVLKKMGLDPKSYKMHAPKVGAICAMRDAGVSWTDVRIRAGWKVNSAMPERYAKESVKKMSAADNTLCF